MPYQCVHCGKFYADATKELIEGCSDCHRKFFYYIQQQKYDRLVNGQQIQIPVELAGADKKKVEQDVRDMIGVEEEEPVVLDLESVRVLEPGKFEIDVVKLFNSRSPVVYKLEEGKYIIDLGKILNETKKEQD